MILVDVATVQADPTINFMSVSGDFNFLAPGEYHKSVPDPLSSTPDQHDIPSARPHQVVWTLLLKSSSCTRRTSIRLRIRVDGLSQLYVASRPWLVLQLGLRDAQLHGPFRCHQQEISDHAPAAFHFSIKPQFPVGQRHIPRFVANHRFPAVLNNLVSTSDIDKLSVPLRLEKFKTLTREAVRIVRDEILANVVVVYERVFMRINCACCVAQ